MIMYLDVNVKNSFNRPDTDILLITINLYIIKFGEKIELTLAIYFLDACCNSIVPQVVKSAVYFS